MRKLLLADAAIMAGVATMGCHTEQGVGGYIHAGGEGIEKVACR